MTGKKIEIMNIMISKKFINKTAFIAEENSERTRE